MIRTKMTVLAIGFLALSGVSAMAATKASHHQMKPAVTAPAEGTPAAAGDAAKPAEPKKAKKSHKAKDKAAGGESAPAPTPEAK